MAQTLTRILVRAVFSTKERRNLIATAIEPDLHAYLGGICRKRESSALAKRYGVAFDMRYLWS